VVFLQCNGRLTSAHSVAVFIDGPCLAVRSPVTDANHRSKASFFVKLLSVTCHTVSRESLCGLTVYW